MEITTDYKYFTDVNFELNTVSSDDKQYISTPEYSLNVMGGTFQGTSTWVQVLSVLFFFTVGLSENIAVIYLYARKEHGYSGNVYVISLAILDILACTILVPQFPAVMYFEFESVLYENFFALLDSIIFSYLYILVAMSVDRVVAVFKPLLYRSLINRQKYIAATIIGFTFAGVYGTKFLTLLIVGHRANSGLTRTVLVVTIIISFTIIIVAYPAIMIKLCRHRRKVGAVIGGASTQTKQAHPAGGNPEMTTQIDKGSGFGIGNKDSNADCARSGTNISEMPHIEVPNTSKPGRDGGRNSSTNNSTNEKTRARHMTTVKIFIGVTLLYAVSYIPAILCMAVVVKQFHVMHAYFFNHIGNPIIYFVVNKKFRDDVKDLLSYICGSFRSLR